MKTLGLPAVLAFTIANTLVAGQGTPITAPTGPAELVETGAGAAFAMTEAEYQALAARLAKNAAFVPITRKPEGVSANVRFGINFYYGGKNRSWAIDGDDATGYTLYADLNANGDLRDDAPIVFEKKDGKHSTSFETTASEGGESYPVRCKLEIDRLARPGETATQLALLRYDTVRRSGEIVVGGKPMKFRVSGQAGVYNESYSPVMLDLDGNGTLDAPMEAYRNSERYVNIGDTTYEFSVDRFGRSLTLSPLAEKRPARVVLLPGHAAPDFAFADLTGTSRKLSDYRGKVVLIDFWGAWCGPCVAATPRLLEAYAKHHSRGFEIIGVNTGDTKAELTSFLQKHQIAWPQTMEADKGPLAALFRVVGWPSYFLVGADGRFAVTAPNGAKFDLMAELAKLLPDK